MARRKIVRMRIKTKLFIKIILAATESKVSESPIIRGYF
jgi:hypothetical protein